LQDDRQAIGGDEAPHVGEPLEPTRAPAQELEPARRVSILGFVVFGTSMTVEWMRPFEHGLSRAQRLGILFVNLFIQTIKIQKFSIQLIDNFGKLK
jgi:hypothetical protein